MDGGGVGGLVGGGVWVWWLVGGVVGEGWGWWCGW